MKAVTFNEFGAANVLTVADIPRPQITAGEILVRVHAAAVNPKDIFMRKGYLRKFTGEEFPMQLGFDYAGEVVEIGSQIETFQVGQRVFGMLDGWHGRTCAEYAAVTPNQAALKPTSLSCTEAAALPLVSSTALQAFRDEANLREEQAVCINGAAGGVGSMAVQIAKIFGARITAVSSKVNHDFLYELGAETCHDYHEVDIKQSKHRFDVFFDVFGNRRFDDIKPILSEEGVWVSTVLQPHVFASVAETKFSSGRKAKLVIVKSSGQDLELIRGWVDDVKLKPIVHTVFPLDQIQAAHVQQETKHTRGKIIISID